MKAGPDIALVGSLVGDPARANMLTALMSGKALTAGELAREAGVTAQTASAHLAKLKAGGLVLQEKQGRHRYFRLTGIDVAQVLEGLACIASRAGHMRTRTGPKDPAMRRARVCYDHLAGDFGVRIFDSLITGKQIERLRDGIALTPEGERFASNFGIDLTELEKARRPVCKECLDWSARRGHLAGGLGAALLGQFYKLKWARRDTDSRAVIFSPAGTAKFESLFG